MENKYTSLELSKKLKENRCELESEYNWFEKTEFTNNDILGNFKDIDSQKYIICTAYDILWDVCVKYAVDFFGEEEIDDWNGDADTYIEDNEKPAYEYHSEVILYLMQQGKKQEAEEYLWDNCIFNLKNKED